MSSGFQSFASSGFAAVIFLVSHFLTSLGFQFVWALRDRLVVFVFAVVVFLMLSFLLIGLEFVWISYLARTRTARKNYDESIASAAKGFAGLHTAIWSQHDEAINGLRSVLLPVKVPMVPRMYSFKDCFEPKLESVKNPSDNISHWVLRDKFLTYSNIYLVRMLQQLIVFVVELLWCCAGWVVNTFFLTPIDWIVIARLRKNAVGDDVSAASCKAVSSHPLGHFPDTCIEELQKTQLFDFVTDRDQGVAATARSVLYNASSSGLAALTEVKSEELTRFLVHNSYFEHAQTLQLIVDEVSNCFNRDSEMPLIRALIFEKESLKSE